MSTETLNGLPTDVTAPSSQDGGGSEAYRFSIDFLPEPAIVFAPDGTIVKANAAAVTVLEADSPNSVIGKNIYSMGAGDSEPVRRAVADLIAGKTAHFELEFLTLKGNPRRLDILDVPILGPTGEVDRVLGFGRDITQQHRAEQERSRLAAIVESSGDAIVSISTDFRITTWNHGAERLLGYTPADAIGQPFTLYVPADMREYARSIVGQISDQPERTVSFEAPCQTKDGRRIDVSTICFAIRGDKGEVVGMGAIHRDISERKRAEREQARLAAIVESSEDAIISLSTDLRITTWNRGAERVLGFSVEEAVGQPFTIYLPAHLRASAEQDIARQIARVRTEPGLVERLEIQLQRKDGNLIDATIVAFGIYDSAGTLVGMSGIISDITAQKHAQQEQVLLAACVNASNDAIIRVSKDAKITNWNPAAERAYGYTTQEAIGQGIELFVPAEELLQTQMRTRRVSETGESASWEQHARRKDGTRFISAVNIFPTRDADGKINGVAGIGRDITQLKQIEKELREAQEYTRGLIESSIDAMVVVDRDKRITDVNEQMAKMTELPKSVLIGSRFDGYFRDPARAAGAIERTLTDGYVVNYDLNLIAASGKEIMVSFNASIFHRAGKVVGIFGVARDVTEQRRTEQTLEEERQYSRSLVECSPDPLLVSSSDLILTDLNERAVRFTGYAREELIGVNLTSLFSDAARLTEIVRQSLEQGVVDNVDLCLLSKSAQEKPVSLTAATYRDAAGKVRGVLIAIHDISEHKRAAEERSALASIVDSSGDAIYSETTDMVITSWNPAAERLFGYTATEAVGRNVALLVPLDRRAELLEHIAEIRRTRKAQNFETIRLRKDGSLLQVAVTQSPIFDSTGTVAALSVTARDISERKQMEAELTRTRDAALEGARLKSEFLANMSHEIRTPLNSIIGMTNLLLDTELTTEQREFAGDVRDGGETLLSLINEILDFSKIAAGKLVFEEIDFELTHTVEETITLVSDQVRRKGLELTVAIDPEVPQFLHGDPARLRQVLLNLLSNAVKFTKHGEISVQVNKITENPKETILRFEVRDTGIGIPKESLHLLFQPFTQVDASTTRHFGGTGLGLSIARELVEHMGGTISVSSTPGAGSTFWFTVKLAKQVEPGKPAAQRFTSLTGTKVIIVDDNSNSREILQRQLTSWGMEARSAGSAEEALELMRSAAQVDPYKVALLDVMMPDVDGIELARTIKADPALKDTAVIFISSAGPRSDFRAQLHGFDVGGWLTKPVPQSSLYNGLMKVLEASGNGAPQSPPSHNKDALQESSAMGKLALPANGKLRVLIAEDNPINQKLAKLQLKKLGIDADTVANGREAVDAVSQQHYDVVLMDCQMPEMDGYDATREIRRREGQQSHTRIVAMTAHALDGDRQKCLETGMDGYISKPVNIKALAAELNEVLGGTAPKTA
jgi:PAS domain S-box-containing protein